MSLAFDAEDEFAIHEDSTFRRFLTPAGDIELLDEIKRNGAGIPRPSSWTGSEPRETDIGVLLQTYRTLMYNLNSIERRIWVRLLLGRPFDEVAKEFGFSRPNLYCRIRGDGKGYGGMAAKNENVAIWWREREEKRANILNEKTGYRPRSPSASSR